MATTLDEALVSCPHCERATSVPIPDTDVDLVVSRSVALYGDNTTVTCPATHEFWVYFC